MTRRIEALRQEAGEAGDWAAVALCDVALGRTAAMDALRDTEWADITREEARAECARMMLADPELRAETCDGTLTVVDTSGQRWWPRGDPGSEAEALRRCKLGPEFGTWRH